jgi:hypothetical protein
MTIGVLLLARPHRAAWMAVPVVARTVVPPWPPVVPPFWVAKPVTPPVAAEACVIGNATTIAPPTAAVASAA